MNIQKYKPNSLIQKYNKNNFNRNIYITNKIIENKRSKYLLKNKMIKNSNTFKKDNIFNINSIYNSKINLLKHSKINNNNYNNNINLNNNQTHILGFQKTKSKLINYSNNNSIRKNILRNSIKERNHFFKKSASSSVYIPSRKEFRKENNNIKEFRIGLLSAGSTSYNNVIIPMISLSRRQSGYFNESENEKSSAMEDLKNKKNYKTFLSHRKNIVSAGISNKNINLKLSGYSKRVEEEFKNVEKLIPKFHKIKIEKGMMDSKLTKTLRDNFYSHYSNIK